MRVSVIVSTYNAPEWLEKVLWAYCAQEYKDFELLIADDGSGPETRDLIEHFRATTSLDLHHVWHEDRGYRRQTILNKAIRQSQTEYLIFSDGDCVSRKDFVGTHVAAAAPGYFLSGGYCKMPMNTSKAIGFEQIITQQAFDLNWLLEQGSVGLSQARKLKARGWVAFLLDQITTAKATFNNCNSSAWKKDVPAVNGYDERMQYGGSDREIGERLVNYGVLGKQIRHRAIVLHLEHARDYKTDDSIRKNLIIRHNTRSRKLKWTAYGITR